MKMCMILIAVMSASVMTDIVSHTRQAASQSALVARQAKGANLQNVMVEQAVINALLDAGAAGGVAVSDCNESTHSFRPRDSSLRGILDSIVAVDPRYTWDVENGTINVLPVNGLPPFLVTRISTFDISQAESPNEALAKLLALPELQKAQLNLGPRAVQGGAYVFCPECPPKETKKISVSLKDATVRECLNAIASAHGNAVWRFRQSECGGRKSFSLDFAAK